MPHGASPSPEDVLDQETICLTCGYDLRGLSASGPCPECGSPIERSLHGNLLRYSDRTYVTALHRGAFLIVTAIVVQVFLYILLVPLAISVASATPGSRQAADLIGAVAGVLLTGVSLAQLYGWWLFSAPDPAYVGVDQGTTARLVVRITVVVMVVLTGLNAALESAQLGMSPGSLDTAAAAVGVVLLVTLAVKFFASMLYVRWLAPRLPNQLVDRRAKLLMWLGPVLVTVGFFLCGIGPIIALVIYWFLLNWILIDIRRIREEQAMPGAA